MTQIIMTCPSSHSSQTTCKPKHWLDFITGVCNSRRKILYLDSMNQAIHQERMLRKSLVQDLGVRKKKKSKLATFARYLPTAAGTWQPEACKRTARSTLLPHLHVELYLTSLVCKVFQIAWAKLRLFETSLSLSLFHRFPTVYFIWPQNFSVLLSHFCTTCLIYILHY